jgi:hypothetical protein
MLKKNLKGLNGLKFQPLIGFRSRIYISNLHIVQFSKHKFILYRRSSKNQLIPINFSIATIDS